MKNGIVVSIGAVKPPPKSDFNIDKANLDELRKEFDWEISYCYPEQEHRGNRYSSSIVEKLINSLSDNTNLMASTKLCSDNIMLKILVRNGFKKRGQSWKS